MFQRITAFILAHRFWSVAIGIVVVLLAWWLWGITFPAKAQTRYMIGTVHVSTIVASVSESGQVAANQTLNITPQAAGEIVGLYVAPGQHVHAGQSIATIDPTSAQQQVTSARQNLQSAQISLGKLQEPAAQLTLTQQQNAITQSQAALVTQYQSSFSEITATFVDLPNIVAGLQDIDLGMGASSGQYNIYYYADQAGHYTNSKSFKDAAYSDYQAARLAYDRTFADYKDVSATPDQATIERMLDETYKTTSLIGNATKSANDLLELYVDQITKNGGTPIALSTTQITNLESYQSKLQTHITALLSDESTLASDKNSITEKQQTLDQTEAGPDTLDVQQQQLNVQKAQDALDQAKAALSKCYVTAPFDGMIASVPVNKFDQAGSGTTIATLITSQQYADLSLNEVDAAKVQLGDKATLTFDAIPDLTLTGTVAQMNPVGTVSQGVVTYNLRVGFDTQDPHVKTGMSVNATIQSAVHQNVLTIPSSAVKTQNGQSYVLAFTPPLASSTENAQGILTSQTPEQIPVAVGIADTSNTEITSGLTDGQQIVVRTTTTGAKATTAAPTTGAGAGGRGGFGGGVRIGG
jgi:HlyD family secretion protein